jgi:translocator protein
LGLRLHGCPFLVLRAPCVMPKFDVTGLTRTTLGDPSTAQDILADVMLTARWTEDRTSLAKSLPPTIAAALLGNMFIGADAMKWFTQLRSPPMQVPLRGFMVVGGLYYASIGTVLHRSAATGNRRAYRLALLVLAGNELWNVALFGRRSPRAGFLGVLGFTVPLSLLQIAVRDDKMSVVALSPYTAWVIGYDIPWTYQLWRYNR